MLENTLEMKVEGKNRIFDRNESKSLLNKSNIHKYMTLSTFLNSLQKMEVKFMKKNLEKNL